MAFPILGIVFFISAKLLVENVMFPLVKDPSEVLITFMIAIERLFENHLSNREISAEELRQFAEDHLGKLSAIPALPATLVALNAPTQVAFDAFDAALSARTVLLAGQIGGTITRGEAFQLIRTTVRQREGRIRDKFAKESAAYAEFFPRGISEVTKARIGQVPALLERLITAADKHQSALGADLLAEFTDLKTTYNSAREGQVDAKGELAQARANLAAARTDLELQLGKNMLAIAAHHLGQPERAKDYFTQSLLEDPDRSEEEPELQNPNV